MVLLFGEAVEFFSNSYYSPQSPGKESAQNVQLLWAVKEKGHCNILTKFIKHT